MKKTVLMVSALMSFNAFAANEGWKNCDDGGMANCEYQIKDGVLTIRPSDNSKPASIPDYEQDCSHIRYPECVTPAPWKWEENSNTVETLKIETGITSIGDDAFENMENIKNVIIPDTVTHIGEKAFVDLWYLKNITIPDSVTSIGEGAFLYIGYLTGTAIYCATNTPCLDKGTRNIQTYDKQDGVYILNGQMYASSNDMMNNENACSDLDSCKIQVLKNKDLCSTDKACMDLINSANNGKMLKLGSKTYQSLDALLKGNYDKRRIYTIEEANFVAGDKNRVSIRYR